MSLEYAQEDYEARYRFDRYKKKDPFPTIPPSLLNAADIADYVSATGMVCPFDERKLKSGSYEAKIRGKCYWWDENGKPHNKDLEKDTDRFELKPNSLVYLQIEPTFRLPDYIALRFNLKISHVHRGVLLGTGPLIDPGFEGDLLIPLHNFSNNSYEIKGGDGLIWIEFTKLSPIRRYKGDAEEWKEPRADARKREGEYKPFREDKKYQPADDYFSSAGKSSLKSVDPAFFSSVKEIHIKTNQRLENYETIIRNFKRIGYSAAALTILTLFIPTWALINDAFNAQDQKWQQQLDDSSALRSELHSLEIKVEAQQVQVGSIDFLMEKINAQHGQILDLQRMVEKMSVNKSGHAGVDAKP